MPAVDAAAIIMARRVTEFLLVADSLLSEPLFLGDQVEPRQLLGRAAQRVSPLFLSNVAVLGRILA